MAKIIVEPKTPDGRQVVVYEGPKGVDYSFEDGKIKVKFSGKTPPWYESMLPFLFRSLPDVTVVK